MWAKVELNNEMVDIINHIKQHNESFEEIKSMFFTKERLSKDCTIAETINLTLIFQEIKKSAIDKVLQNKELNFPEGFVIERLIAKHFNEKIPSVEEHFKQIKEECSYSKKRQEKKCKKICKIYNSFLDKLLLKSKLFFKGEENERNN